MSPEEIDKAIDALPENDLEELYDAAFRHWSFRAQNWALPIAFFAVMFALSFAMRALVRSYWPGSLVVATLATLVWCGAFFSLLRFILSMRVAMWRTRWAARREYRFRSGAA
jgi:hypothetical protein